MRSTSGVSKARATVAALAWVVLAVACRPPETSGVGPELVPPGATVDFGLVPVLNDKTVEVPLLNIGRADLNVTALTVQSADGTFTLGEGTTLVAAGQTVNVKVTFTPKEEAKSRGVLVIESDDQNNPRVEVQLEGEGSTKGVIEVDPERLDFGRVPECSSAVKSFVIRSKGTADLVVQEISFVDGSSSAFSFVGSTKTPATVKKDGGNGLPGQIQLTVKVTVAAGTTGPLEGSIRLRSTDPARREVLIPLSATVNRAPVPTIAPLGNGAPGSVVMLDGSGSMDPDGDTPLSYKWTLRSKPLTATTTLASTDMATSSMTLDGKTPGSYEVQLDVVDSQGVKSCTPARQTVVAVPAQQLLVEMFWDNTVTDLDLHVLRTPESKVGSPDDCFFQNKKPDWGKAGDASDDPQLIDDALRGYGPEVFGWVNPIDGTSRVVVDFADENLSATPASKATVRVYVRGVVKAEVSRVLEKAGSRWAVVDVEWPTGNVTVLP